MQKMVHTNPRVDEIHKKRYLIEEFSAFAADHQSEENGRAMTHPDLVNEIKIKRPSISQAHSTHNKHMSGAIHVN